MKPLDLIKRLLALWNVAHSYPRVLLLRLLGARVGRQVRLSSNYVYLPWARARSVIIGSGVQIGHSALITVKERAMLAIGTGTGIGRFCSIFCGHEIIIGSGCLLSDWFKVSDSSHIFTPGCSPVFSGLAPVAKVTIGPNTFAGQGVVIEPGVEVGANCVIGAYSVLTRGSKFPDNSVIVGAPARIARTIP